MQRLLQVTPIVLVGILYIAFAYFDGLRHVPGFYCEGFGCIGLGIAYLVLAVVIIPLLITIITFFSVRENKVRHSVESLVISLLIMLVAVYIVGQLNDLRVERDIQAGKAAENYLAEQIAQNKLEANTKTQEEETLSVEQVDMERNNSGRGVFQAKVVPDEVFVDVPTTVTVSAEIGSVKDVDRVMLYSVSDTLTEPVAMYDDGTRGDDRAHDTVFTTQKEIRISSPREIVYEIKVLYTDGYEATSYQSLKLSAYEPLPKGASVDASTFAEQVKSSYLAYRDTMSMEDARARVLSEVKSNPSVSFAELSGVNMSVEYRGVRVWIQLYGPVDGPPIDSL